MVLWDYGTKIARANFYKRLQKLVSLNKGKLMPLITLQYFIILI